ncbi:MAG: purine-nucleoside phosphorylase [Cytophagales bacterium]|nr:purine-nucleoside phosphorylase [Cytophagales bacterium]
MNLEKINQATNFIKEKIHFTPEIGLILGSGLGSLADEIENPVKISYNTIPGFPHLPADKQGSTVTGHAGQLVLGKLEGKQVIAMQGRFHYYEGYSLQEATIPVRVMKKTGVEKIIVTNAAGGVNETFEPGDLMIITDHINFAFANPLIGKNYNEFGPRFPDTSEAYAPELIKVVKEVAASQNINIKEGVYQFSSGPTYETPAETKAARFLGADAVGMSTVPEVLVAVHSGIKVVGISCITNMASGMNNQPLSHDEVIETTERVKGMFCKLVRGIVSKI